MRNFLLALLFFSAATAANPIESETIERDGYRFEVGPVPAFVVRRPIPEQWTSKVGAGPEVTWRNWLYDSQVDLSGRIPVRYVETVYQVLAANLVGDGAKYQVTFNPEYQQLALHRFEVRRDGEWSSRLDPKRVTLARREAEFEASLTTGNVTALIVLDDVQNGDLVRVSYSIRGENPILAGLDHEEFLFAWVDAILERHVRVLAPPDAEYVVERIGAAPEPTVRRTKQHAEYEFIAREVDGIRHDGDTPSWYMPYPSVVLAEKRSWKDVAAWALQLYPEPKPLPADLEARIAKWRELPTRDERIMAALRAVQEDVRYFGHELGESTHRPSEPHDTWTRKHGDCKDKARLLATVLQRLDIPARPALVSVSRERAVEQLLPSGAAFDHVIVQIGTGPDSLWVDPTMTQQRGTPATLPVPTYGVALPVGKGIGGLVEIDRARAVPERTRVHELMTPSEDGKSATLVIETEYRGASADRIRRELASSGDKELQRMYAEFYRRRYPKAEIASPLDIEDDPAENRLRVTESYRLEEPWVIASGASRALDFHADTIEPFVSLPGTVERTAPIALRHPIEIEHTVEIKVPKGWTWSQTGENETIDVPGVTYVNKVAREGDKVVMHDKFVSREDHVAKDDVVAHLSGRRRIGEAIGRRIILEMPAAQSRSDRDARLKSLMKGLLTEGDANEESRR